jgi:hypothetical protein
MRKKYIKIPQAKFKAYRTKMNQRLLADSPREWSGSDKDYCRESIEVLDKVSGLPTGEVWFPIPDEDPWKSTIEAELTAAELKDRKTISGSDADVKYRDEPDIPDRL